MEESYALTVKRENAHMSLTAIHRNVRIFIVITERNAACMKSLMKIKGGMSGGAISKSVCGKTGMGAEQSFILCFF